MLNAGGASPFIGSITIIKLWAFAAVHHNDPCLDLGRSQVQADVTLMHITSPPPPTIMLEGSSGGKRVTRIKKEVSKCY